MLPKRTLLQLLDLARATAERAARALGASRSRELDEDGRLKLLLGYREEYLERFARAARAGLEGSEWTNYHAFLLKLDAAIEQQRRTLAERRVSVEQCSSAWSSANGRVKAYDTLDARRRVVERRTERRREQRVQNEFILRNLSAKP